MFCKIGGAFLLFFLFSPITQTEFFYMPVFNNLPVLFTLQLLFAVRMAALPSFQL